MASSDGLFSILPDDILRKILSSLTLKHRAIASPVSTKWYYIIVSFNDLNLVQTQLYTKRVTKLAADKSITELYFFNHPSSFSNLYQEILESRLLTVLHLKYCRIEGQNFDDIKELPSLKEIYFDHVSITPTNFSNLINKCPSIVELTLIDCYSLYSISVPDLNQLKKVHVNGSGFGTIEIKSRNLLEFHLFTSSSAPATKKLDLCACTKLQVLKIDSEYIPIGFPEDISSAFPCLKSLVLRLCKRLNKIKLVSPELEDLTLNDMVDLEDAIIVTPNIHSFKLIDMKKVPSCSFLSFISGPDLNKLEKVHISCGYEFMHKIEMKARNLQEFHLFSTSLLEVDLCTCTELQVLKIDCDYIPIGFPKDISSAFPCLKSLFLRSCKRLKKIKLLSPELENLTLSDMVDLEDAVIVTPNLRSFKLIDMEEVPSSSPVVGSRLMEVEIGLKYIHAISRLLQHLRTYAENLGENITLSLSTNATESKELRFHFGNLGSNIRPLCIKHINLVIFFSPVSRYEFLIEELLSYFRPKTLLVTEISRELINYTFIQVLLDELKFREMEHGKCYKCSNSYMCWRGKCNKNSNYMCWRYFLKGFKESSKRQGFHQISLEFQWSE